MNFTGENSVFFWPLIGFSGALLAGYFFQPTLLQALGILFGGYCCFKLLSFFGFGPLVRK